MKSNLLHKDSVIGTLLLLFKEAKTVFQVRCPAQRVTLLQKGCDSERRLEYRLR